MYRVTKLSNYYRFSSMRQYDSVVDVNRCLYRVRSVLLTLLYFCQHPPQSEVLRYMSEAIISRRGYNSSGNGSSGLVTEVITENTTWTVPAYIGGVSVRIFGGGGSGSWGSGGGGGYMNNADLSPVIGANIPITIGAGGVCEHLSMIGFGGGTSSFGSYLSANGGGGAGQLDGGSGGSGGGGGGNGAGHPNGNRYAYYRMINGGQGTQFGGGGAFAQGGDGGIWGGGGGTGGWQSGRGGSGGTYGGGGAGCIDSPISSGGEYGGQGGIGNGQATDTRSVAKNGINTIGNNQVDENCQGAGLSGLAIWGAQYNYRGMYAGGGCGGNAGGPDTSFPYDPMGGGGGGYGGNGGNASVSSTNTSSWWQSAGGGGGGYGKGADGGNAGYRRNIISGGGGGGYFAKGGDGGNDPGGIVRGGGGGSYGRGGGPANQLAKDTVLQAPTFGGGGCGYYNATTSTHGQNGASGICIIQYYKI